MSPAISTSTWWADYNVAGMARNYSRVVNTSYASNSYYRMPSSGGAVESLATTGNYFLARNRRILFDAVQTNATAENIARNPLYEWAYPDCAANERTYTFHVVAHARTSANVIVKGTTMLYQTTNSAVNVVDERAVAQWNTWYGLKYERCSVDRGDASNATWRNDGVSTSGNYICMDICAIADDVPDLDTNVHRYCNVGQAETHGKALAGTIQSAASAFHEVRQTCLPRAISWCAIGGSLGLDGEPITVTNTTYRNLFDAACTNRESNSIGAVCPCEYGGVALSQNVRVRLCVYACTNNGNHANVKFIGPNHIANNERVLTINTTEVQWYGTDDDFIYLNPTALDGCTSTQRNKIDVLAECNTATALNVIAFYGWETYG